MIKVIKKIFGWLIAAVITCVILTNIWYIATFDYSAICPDLYIAYDPLSTIVGTNYPILMLMTIIEVTFLYYLLKPLITKNDM